MPSAARSNESDENIVSSSVKNRGRERAADRTSFIDPTLEIGSARSNPRISLRTAETSDIGSPCVLTTTQLNRFGSCGKGQNASVPAGLSNAAFLISATTHTIVRHGVFCEVRRRCPMSDYF